MQPTKPEARREWIRAIDAARLLRVHLSTIESLAREGVLDGLELLGQGYVKQAEVLALRTGPRRRLRWPPLAAYGEGKPPRTPTWLRGLLRRWGRGERSWN